MIGIYGLGGIGKTTISRVVYNDIFHLFQSSIFIENVRERSQDYPNRLQLQKELLNGVTKGKNLEINSIHEGINLIKQRLCSKKVLLILDDVDKLEQLDFLAGKHDWFGPRSRIIITTRDQQLLRVHKVDVSYEVKELDYKESIQLFCQHAFKQNILEKDYVSISNDVVGYLNGLPLAIIIVGSSLFSKSKDEWESTLKKLKEIPNMQVQNVLKISYEGLDEIEKEIFLDVACFFKGCDENDVTRRLDHAKCVIRVLSDKCLITLSHNIIGMHDLVQEMGREIVRHDHHKEPGKWSRLWDLEDICLILRKKTGTEAIEGIFLDMSRSREISFTTEAFKRMERLRLFKVYWSYSAVNDIRKEYQKLLLPKDFEFPSYNLRYLHWEGYSLNSLPSNFEGENLIELNLEHSNIKHLWQREKGLQKLKVLNLSGSQQLTDMPRFSNMSNLEKLNIEFCGSLNKVDLSIGFLTKLTLLNLSGCRKIRSLPSTIQRLVSLESLYLDGTAIEKLPFSIHHLTLLFFLSARNCKNLRSLPSGICKLESLEYLYLNGCSKLETFPKISTDMKCLKDLDLSGTCIKEPPSSIEYLNHLTSLRLVNCKNLETFPQIMKDMKCLKELNLSGTCIKELPSSIEYLNHLTSLRLVGCKNLESLPSSICKLKSLKSLSLRCCSNLETFPKIMEDMGCLEELDLSGTCIKELPSSIEFLNHLTSLSLVGCKNLRSLPSSICKLKSLKSLSLRCSNLETFPEIIEKMECLHELDLSGTCIKELPSSVEFLNHLTSLRLVECEKLSRLPGSICKLKSLISLSLWCCSNLKTFPKIVEDMKCLKYLNLSGAGIKELPSSIGCLNHLTSLSLSHCKNLRSLPSSIGRLKLLKELDLNGCPNLVTEDMENSINLGLSETQNVMDGVTPSDLWCLSSLVKLDLSQNDMRHIPTAITQLCNLEHLNISHCNMLEEIPDLPSSLREIDAHDCPSLGTLSNPSTLLWSSLLKWLEKVEAPLEWGKINLGSNGIPGWVRHQQMGSHIRIELPMSWSEDDQFLGFAFFFLHLPKLILDLSLKFDEEEYTYKGLSFPLCACHGINGSEDEVWLLYCPKTAIWDKFRSDQYMHLEASFDIFTFGSWDKIKGCGVHLIYSQDHQQNHISLLDFPESSGDNRSTAKDIKRSHDDATHNQAEEPYHKRLRESNTHLKL
ncbi:hypothetical protein PVL29_002389 [Vitis rotundifolia]|uniref:ADP-ribosyl cyclase/cyclic ADP-ribose hydrolase n=1 Tax=Vitis rotundifolia TaxID=103349 RepID=A0AA39E3T1_VITRO|nr:hypothetical protein PVL29_002389 [Vitis rotundifolia]